MADFRSAPGRSPQWIGSRGTFSNFEFVDQNFASHSILRRIFSLARKLGYGGFLIEHIVEADCKLLAEENRALALRLPDFNGATVTRFSFFTGERESAPGEFLGYAIFKQDRNASGDFGHVYEAVMKPPRGRPYNNFIHCLGTYQVVCTLGVFSVRGALFAQQNDATFVCAHVALRTLLSTMLPDRDIDYATINRLAGVDHTDPAVRVGARQMTRGRGLRPQQIEAVIRGIGFEPDLVTHEPDVEDAALPEGVEFQRLLYGYLESGSPALLGFTLAPGVSGASSRHIIPVLGHTFNEDLWVPEAERQYFAHNRGYFPSESWLSTWVAHDDNFGPYVCLPRHYLGRAQFRLLVGCRLNGVSRPAEVAEAFAYDFARKLVDGLGDTGRTWLGRFAAFSRASLLVLRTFVVEKSVYAQHLSSLRDKENFDFEEANQERFLAALPERFWLIEFSAPELFPASRRKFGDILVHPDAAVARHRAVIAARLPGFLLYREGAEWKSRKTRLAGHTDILSLSAS